MISRPTSKKSRISIDSIREPALSMYIYRCLLYINDETNEFGAAIFPAVFGLTLCLSVIVNTSLIQYAPQLHFGILPLLSIALITSSYQVAIYYAFGLMDEHSRKWMSSWKLGRFKNLSKSNRRLMQMYIRSCRPLSLILGYWGPIKCITSLKAAGKIVFYTGKVVLTLRN